MIARRVLLIVALSAAAASLGGCISLLPKAVPAELYRFGAGDEPPPQASPAVPARVVVLGPIAMPREAAGDGILTTEGPGTAYINGARWVAAATVLFHQALERSFDRSAPSLHLLTRGETGRTDATLVLEVSRFEAHYDGPKAAPIVRVGIRARLSGADGAPIAARVFDIAKPADANRVAAIVAAYDQATSEALNALAQWVSQTTPSSPPGGVRRP